jgi:catechol 2,3-dioxygenase-like lactoylglutathione lyase family enzyme
MSDAPLAAGLRIHHVGLTVSDIERSVEFYGTTLGMHLVRRRVAEADYLSQQTGFEGVRLAAASFKPSAESPQTIELVQYLTHAGPALNSATNQVASAHLCFETPDIQQTFSRLQAQGVRFKTPIVPITSGPNQGGSVVYFYDPDGFILELFQPPKGAT